MAFDVSLARGQFPALSNEWVYMDNAGGTQVPFQVAEAVRDYMLNTNVQHGGSYEISQKAAETVSEGRRVVAELINADPGEIVFGANMSSLFRNLALVLSEIWDPDDEIIVTQAEHEANVGAWDYLSQFGIVVRTWEIDPETMTFDVSSLVDLITDKTRLIAVTHASNVLGSVFPIKEVLKLSKGCGAYLCVDGGQYVPHRRLDVKDIGADFYLFSTYKTFGAHLGVMYGKRDVLEGIPKWGHFFVEEKAVPQKFELGTQNFEGIAGLVGLEKYFRAVGMSLNEPFPQVVDKVFDGFQQHETELTRELLTFLSSKKRVHIVGEADVRMIEDRLPIVAFLVDETDPQELVQEVDKARIGIRWGHFNSPRLLDALQMLEYKGVIRISLAHYNTKTEVDRLKKTLEPLIS